MVSDTEVKGQFWSIERAIAFVVAPIVTPLSGALALWLGKHFPGLHVTGSGLTAFAAVTAGGVAAGFIKWLDGRQKFVRSIADVESKLAPVAATIPREERRSLLAAIEGIVSNELARIVKVTPSTGNAATGVLTPSAPVETGLVPEWPVPGDPAPGEDPAPPDPASTESPAA